jgi:hypothetical protein
MKSKNRLLKIYLVIVSISAIAFLGLKLPGAYYMFKAKKAIAVGGFPMQFGLTGVTITPCFWLVADGVCKGGPLCVLIDQARCNLSSDVRGAPAGGDGSAVILQKSTITKIGLSPGGQVIVGASTALMAQVSASAAGMMIGP